ncbi:2-keto-4-pentenoate hydratase [Pantoea sp. Ap-967]|uniref:2-keto-4-pentenoate hydratase n=1 Tax=Pantoea sp. Ap-967 TaxID=2608362 RepID=UPI0014239F6F|nr:2-keto-4-pentenoate hydratase [Pantoea sp. Ap-967]NIE73306.1 2-keto-4-pentenoate hydratase [Pantoea sp. Ap-967]
MSPMSFSKQVCLAMQEPDRPLVLAQEQHPQTREQAYEMQLQVLEQLQQSPGGWKVGPTPTAGLAQGSVLPGSWLLPTGAQVHLNAFNYLGLEMEIAFRFKQAFSARTVPYTFEEVEANLQSMAATFELVTSRLEGWPSVPALLQLADLLNHGRLIVGDFIAYDRAFDFQAPTATLTAGGRSVCPEKIGNPAGDPRLLLPWLVNHHTCNGLDFLPEWLVTTGSYTGLQALESPAVYRGQFQGLPPVELTLS